MATAVAAQDFKRVAAADSAGGLGINWRISIAQRRDACTGISQWLDEWGLRVTALLALLWLTCVAWPI